MKPDDPTPDLQAALDSGEIGYEDLVFSSEEVDDSRYLHWQKLKHLTPPHGWTHRRWWFQLKWSRRNRAQAYALFAADDAPLMLTRMARIDAQLHELDLVLGGRVTLPTDTLDAGGRDQYIVSSLMQEAIHSSLYEGAVSTVADAKALLRSGRTPGSHSERMIYNNYVAMTRLRDLKDQPLSAELVLELHRIVTDGTLDRPADAGRLQTSEDQRIVIFDQRMHRIVHSPPPAHQLQARLERLVQFANAPNTEQSFVHPILRAILIHFQLAYDHPFADGNGRTARALFYWSLLRSGYWLAEFLSISRLLYRHRGRYEDAFLQVETDGFDVSYFVLHQLGVLRDAVQALHEYAEHRQRALADLRRQMQHQSAFNHRQQSLLEMLLRKPDTPVTHESHGRTHAVTHVTARADLQELARAGLLSMQRSGKRLVYYASADLAVRLRS